MRTTISIAILISLTAAAAAHGGQQYRPSGFLRGGYSERATATGEWIVKGSAKESGRSIGIALYRAAEIAQQDGVSELRVVKQSIESTTVQDRNYRTLSFREVTVVTVRPIREAGDRTMCAMPDPAKCLTLPVAGLMATYGPTLAMPAGKAGAPVAAKLPLVVSSPLTQAVADLLRRHPEMRATPVPVAARVGVPARVVAPSVATRQTGTARSAAETYAAQLEAAQPAKGGDAKRGWTISD